MKSDAKQRRLRWLFHELRMAKQRDLITECLDPVQEAKWQVYAHRRIRAIEEEIDRVMKLDDDAPEEELVRPYLVGIRREVFGG